ncbi:MAG: ABC transporter permease [Acidobacteria bacterium]|nr:ABC transporter permease [Acidobacteriota bacterium]
MLRQAIESLTAYRGHAIASGVGVAVGIAATIVLVSLVSGFERQLVDQLQHDGVGSLVVRSVATNADVSLAAWFRPPNADRLRNTVGVRQVSVERSIGTQPVTGVNEIALPISAVQPGSLSLRALAVSEGRWFAEGDISGDAAVAVLGPGACAELFTRARCHDATILVAGVPYRVVGVLAWVGARQGVGRSSRDRQVYLPLNDAVSTLPGDAQGESVLVGLTDVSSHATADAERSIRRLLLASGARPDSVEIRSASERQESAQRVFAAAKALGIIVGCVCLGIGIIGVMNLMYLAAKARTVEIGVRRAVGATRRHIVGQFLIEALMVAGTNGVAGLIIGTVICVALASIQIPGVPPPVVSWPTAVLGFTLTVLAGVIAGLGPARWAAAQLPSDALRAE